MRADVAAAAPGSWATSRSGTPALDLRGRPGRGPRRRWASRSSWSARAPRSRRTTSPTAATARRGVAPGSSGSSRDGRPGAPRRAGRRAGRGPRTHRRRRAGGGSRPGGGHPRGRHQDLAGVGRAACWPRSASRDVGREPRPGGRAEGGRLRRPRPALALRRPAAVEQGALGGALRRRRPLGRPADARRRARPAAASGRPAAGSAAWSRSASTTPAASGTRAAPTRRAARAGRPWSPRPRALDLRGVMAVAPLGEDPVAGVRPAGRRSPTACARTTRARSGVSAGMSDDLEAAIAAGATHVRVGTAPSSGRRPPLR